jgi:hypothetical protein
MNPYCTYPSPLRSYCHRVAWNVFYKRRRLGLLCRYIAQFGRFPNLFIPKTFNEIILKKLLFDRDPRLTLFADKIAVRAYVQERLGTDAYLTKLYGVYDTFAEIDCDAMPQQFVLKPNHGSAWSRIIRNWGAVDKEQLAAEADGWLKKNYGLLFNEWAYIHIPPKLLAEELLAEEQPIDYRIVCFHGCPRIIYTRIVRNGQKYINMYDMHWNLFPVRYGFPVFPDLAPPSKLDELIKIATTLAHGTDFIRVDLYQIGERIVFGELTNYPNGGQLEFDPPEWDRLFGQFYEL